MSLKARDALLFVRILLPERDLTEKQLLEVIHDFAEDFCQRLADLPPDSEILEYWAELADWIIKHYHEGALGMYFDPRILRCVRRHTEICDYCKVPDPLDWVKCMVRAARHQ